jgi:DNA (cytosine-5)-methyltransferase 1
MGYHRAGFDVVGVDNRPQPRYPFEFHQGDAMTWPLGGFDVIHASPPCQDYSRAMQCFVTAGTYPRLIEPIRERLVASGAPWIIENVPGAPLPTQTDLFGSHGAELCGTMFHLRFWRHRLFETSSPIFAPRGCDHSLQPMNPHKAPTRALWRSLLGDAVPIERVWRDEMGVGWMSGAEGREAIPPAYTEHIGLQLLDVLERAA